MTVKSKQSGIVRTGTGTADIRAYVNSCLHRGTILRTEGGNVRHIKCPVHGLTWGLDGKLAGLPCAWDFPQVDRENFCLPEAQVGLWGGFVFINFDAHCEPLESCPRACPARRWATTRSRKLWMPCSATLKIGRAHV